MSYRLAKVNSLLLKEINKVIQLKMGDPRLGELGLITLTAVKVSTDLRRAKVFVAATGDEPSDRKKVKALNHGRVFVQRELSRAVYLKYIPELIFYLDETLMKAERIEKIIEDLHKNDPVKSGDDE